VKAAFARELPFHLWLFENFFRIVQQPRNSCCLYFWYCETKTFLAIPCFINKCRKKLVLYPPH